MGGFTRPATRAKRDSPSILLKLDAGRFGNQRFMREQSGFRAHIEYSDDIRTANTTIFILRHRICRRQTLSSKWSVVFELADTATLPFKLPALDCRDDAGTSPRYQPQYNASHTVL